MHSFICWSAPRPGRSPVLACSCFLASTDSTLNKPSHENTEHGAAGLQAGARVGKPLPPPSPALGTQMPWPREARIKTLGGGREQPGIRGLQGAAGGTGEIPSCLQASVSSTVKWAEGSCVRPVHAHAPPRACVSRTVTAWLPIRFRSQHTQKHSWWAPRLHLHAPTPRFPPCLTSLPSGLPLGSQNACSFLPQGLGTRLHRAQTSLCRPPSLSHLPICPHTCPSVLGPQSCPLIPCPALEALRTGHTIQAGLP